MIRNVDLLILGGGCAGLALGRELAQRSIPLTTAIIEPRMRHEEDRTWCFWHRAGEDLPVPTEATWKNWQLSKGNQHTIHTGCNWTYGLVRSSSYYDAALAAIGAAPNVALWTGIRAGAIGETESDAEVDTNAGTFRAKWVVDTRPPSRARLEAAPIAQVFSGVEIETPDDRFDPGTAYLMDQLRSEPGRVAFDYVLPLSPRRALIEHTVFSTNPVSPSDLDPACGGLVEKWAGRGAKTVRSERGWLPMGLPAATELNGPIYRAGTSAGALRPSSGYGFLRIQRWAKQCAAHLALGHAPVSQAEDPAFRQAMDQIFLNALSRNISSAPAIFMALSKALDGDAFARFMTDAATPLDWTRAVFALPKAQFLKAAVQPIQPRRHQLAEC